METTSFKKQLENAKAAAYKVALLSGETRTAIVRAIGEELSRMTPAILEANAKDLDHFTGDDSIRDRLLLNEERIAAMINATKVVADLPDPIGKILGTHTIQPVSADSQELALQRVSVPLGLIGMIYESRPNVTLDAAILAIKSGNGIVLRGGHDAFESSKAIVAAIHGALVQFDVPIEAVYLMPTARELVPELLTAEGVVDVVIPRGSNQLIQMVRRQATVPVIETGAGVCHTYVSASADIAKAAKIIENAKLQRTGVCNALDTIVVDETVARELFAAIMPAFSEHGVQVNADEASFALLHELGYETLAPADEKDFGREYLGFGCSVKTVASVDEALAHIRKFSSKHTEVIVSQDNQECERFLLEVDAASVISNASSRFTDGEVFGLGAEMGISTQKLHARGPFGIDKLVTEKWVTRGDGHVRA